MIGDDAEARFILGAFSVVFKNSKSVVVTSSVGCSEFWHDVRERQCRRRNTLFHHVDKRLRLHREHLIALCRRSDVDCLLSDAEAFST